MRKNLLWLLLCFCVAGCGESADQANAPVNADAGPVVSASSSMPASAATSGTLDARTAQMWSRSCALCHVDGNAGAPRLGNSEEWQPRLAQGEAVLLKHTVEGFKDMPPLGYCMACEKEHLVAMTRFMSGSKQSGDAP